MSLFHVSSVRNRESIVEHGLDWTLMGAARGIAGAATPEVSGVFLCVDMSEAEWFIKLNNTGGPVDLWEVTGIETRELVVSSTGGYQYIARPIPPAQVNLLTPDVPWADSSPIP